MAISICNSKKKNIKKQVDYTQDKELLKAIKNLLDYAKVKESEQIVGYEPGGKPITKAELIKDIEESEQQIENGQWLTQVELKKQIKSW